MFFVKIILKLTFVESLSYTFYIYRNQNYMILRNPIRLICLTIFITVSLGVYAQNSAKQNSEMINVNSGKILVDDFIYKPYDILVNGLEKNSFDCADNTASAIVFL